MPEDEGLFLEQGLAFLLAKALPVRDYSDAGVCVQASPTVQKQG